MASVRLRFRSRKVQQLVRAQVQANMLKAVVELTNIVKLKLNRSQPRRTLPSGRIVGLDPSLPGEPPRKITGQLQRSITGRVAFDVAGNIVGIVGSDLVKAAPLEFGTRDGKVKARPFLRPSLLENRTKLARIIATGRG